MVGYSFLSQSNEALALELLEEHKRILRPAFTKHDGREIETAGDLFFVEFHSAVDAANCAIEIQTLLYERNKSVDPEKRIRLRIGLHIGDVVEMGNHVHGDGVNIAARLEPLATPEGICLSEDFARAVQNKLNYPVLKKGEARLKNISSPMEIYCIQLPWVKEKTLKPEADNKSYHRILKYVVPIIILISAAIFLFSPFFNDDKELHTRLAVLPFLNIGGDPGDEYFAEGMTEQIITSLSNLSGLNVIARSSVMKYKDAPKDIRVVGEELNVSTVLEGSIRKYMNKARITVNLIDVSTQQSLWAMDYDRELQDIFVIQSEIAQSIANELEVKLNREEKERLGKKVIVNTDAYNTYLLGRFHLNRRTIDGVTRSISYFEAAINYDNSFALAYSGLADAYTLISVGYGNIPLEEAALKAKENVMKSLELDENLAEAHASLAYIKFRLEWKFDEAEQEFKKAIELGPSYAQAHEWYALYLSLRGRYKEALQRMKKAHELNPFSVSVSNGIGRIYYFMRDFKNAIAQFKKTLEMDPNYAEAYASLGMTYDLMKDYNRSIPNLEKAVNLSNRRLIILSRLAYSYALAGRKDEVMKIKQEIDERSKTEDVSDYYYVPIYAARGDYDKVFELLENSYKQKFSLLLYLKADKGFADLTKDPRYDEFVKKIGL
jgi:TolB-like protein/Flp pilus assembly protein TadD